MIAKLIVHGETREKTIETMLNALGKLRIKGVKTTIPFCKAVLTNKVFVNGTFNTSFIEKDMEKTYFQEKDEEMLAAFFATYNYANEIREEKDTWVDHEKGKNIDPWLLNKRLR